MFGSRIIRRFLASRDGTILVLVAMAVAIFLGFVALSFDLGRVASTQSELQSYADNVALAAAGELDGGSDSCTRAKAAAANLIADTQTFGAGGNNLTGDAGTADCAAVTLGDYQLRFLSDLPPDDGTALTSYVTTDAAAAVYAWVQVNQHTVDMPFANAFAALTGNAATNAAVDAEAVAGFTMYACDVTPLMFCLPNANYKANDHIGDQIFLRSGGSGGGAWQPGNFGFVDLSAAGIDELGPCNGLTNQSLSRCLLGAEDFLTKCFSQRGIDTKPGQNVGTYEAAINVRFDMYQATMNGKKTDADYRPAPSVIKGVVPKSGTCVGNSPTDSPSEPMGRDTCFGPPNTCPDGARFGDGNWNRGNYVTANHGTDSSTSAPLYPAGTNANSTRYAMYLAEIAKANGITPASHPSQFAAAQSGFLGTATPNFNSAAYKQFVSLLKSSDSGSAILTKAGVMETGRPTCSSNRSPDPERRVVILAGVDCNANPITGAATGVPVQEFFKVFLTEPAGADPLDTSNFNIWGEVIGSAGGPGSSGSAGIFRDVVQLYR